MASSIPVHPKAAARLPEGVRPTPEELASLQEMTNQELRESDQNARETSQDLRESDQDARESRQDAQKFDQASRETGQDTRQSNQDARESRQDARKIDLDSRQSGQNLREVGQEVLKSDQNARETSQDLRESDQDARESRQDARKIDQDARQSGQNLREVGQEFLESGQALADIKVRYQLLVDSVTDYAIYMLDPEGRVVTWNVGAERLKGYTAEEALGLDYSVFFRPEDAQTGLPAQELAAAAREGRYETQAWRQRKDGSRFWALVTLTAIRGSLGELCGFAKVTRDMTAQRAAEEATQSHNDQLERYRIIVENVGDYAIYTLDAKGIIDSWSPKAERDTGYSPQEMLGRHYSWLFAEEDQRAGVAQWELEEAARIGRCASEAWRICRDGSRTWAVGVVNAVRDKNGKLVGFVRVGRDMTQEKRAEEELKSHNAQLERYRIIIESIADYVIFTLDPEGRIDGWSSGAQSILGYTAEEALGREYSMVFTAAEMEAGEPRREMEEAARHEHCMTDNWRVRRGGSLFWASGVLTAIHDKTGKLTGYVRVARDMTPQKKLEESLSMMAAELEGQVAERTIELEASVAELQRKNREVEAFVYIVSHDLRAPLVNVQGFVRELEESCKHLRTVVQSSLNWELYWSGVQPILDEEMGGALHFISASTAKFERLIDALLGFSRLGRLVYRMVRVDVRELVANATANFQQAINEAGAEVEVGPLPFVIADATALGQVFSNLIGNAIKYRSPERPLKIEVGGEAKGDMVRYWVRDNGQGIPEYAKERLFRVFQRFHPQQAEGEGMGLAIAYRIVERHGGKTWVESRQGAGSTFNFSLPITQPTATIEAQEATGDESVRI
jgi:hypothetical protein